MHPPLPPHPRVSFSPAKRRFLYKASPSALEVWSAGREESQKAETDRRAKLNGALLPVADMPELLAEIHIKVGVPSPAALLPSHAHEHRFSPTERREDHK